MANIRINTLPPSTEVLSDDVLPMDGLTTRKIKPVDMINSVRPFATQSEAEAGAITAKAMSPLTTKQAIAAQLPSTAAGRSLLNSADDAAQRTLLGLGDAAVLGVGTSAGTVAAGNDTRIVGAAHKSANLADLSNVATARTNLGLGTAATRNVGDAPNTVAAGDDVRFLGVAGIVDQAIAEAGTNNTGIMSPLRVSQHAKANVVGRSPELYGGTSVAAITAAIASGGPVDLFPVVYPTTTLDNLDIDKMGVVPPGAEFQSVMAGDSLVRDRASSLIGYAMNHREELMWTGSYPRNVAGTAITTGNIGPAPMSSASPAGPVDMIAHWYGVWGIEWLRLATGIADASFDAWYDWHWNWTSDVGYDPTRHPVMGWYRQQDPDILDWQSYWLREAGIKAICPVAFNLDISTWHLSGDMHHWLYQLFNNAPNFKQLSYVPWVQSSAWANQPSSPTPTEIATQWDSIIFSLCDAYPNNYVLHHGGKRWMALYVWDSEFLRTEVFDTGGGSTNYAAFLAARADAAATRGYDGIAVMCHSATSDADMNRASLLANDVLYLHAPYGGAWASPAATDYDEIIDNFAPPSSGVVVNVSTSLESVAPITEFDFPGSTPAKFGQYLTKAIRHVVNSPDLPKCISIYNVSEWAEGGPGLTPNRQTGWGYLDMIRAAAASESTIPLRRQNLVALTLQNSWVNYGSSEEPPQCYKNADGVVYVSGVIKNGTTTSGTLITTLPAGYRPAKAQVFPIGVSGGTTAILLAANGQITALGTLNATLTSLSGISFRAA